MTGLRRASGLIAALAVLVVSATCTQAACLLPMGQAHPIEQKIKKSCCEDSDQSAAPTHRVPHDERCPMCQNPLVIAKNVDQGASFHAATLSITFFCPVSVIPTVPYAVAVLAHPSDRPPPCPLSLLALHCALLT